MSIGAIGGMPANPYSPVQGSQKPQEGEKTELTTITTHCNKEHEHDRSCPHTVFTQPAPKAGEPGYFMDQRA